MTTTNPGVNVILNLLAQLNAEKEQIEREVRNKLAELEKKIAAVQMTYQLLVGTQNIPEIAPTKPVMANLTKAKTQIEALKIIAKMGNGTVNATKATHMLIEAGRVKGKPRNAVPHIYTLMKDSDEWEKVSPGTFKLLNSHKKGQQQLIKVG